MKNYFSILIIIIGFIGGCRDAEILPKEYPLIITKEVTEINSEGVTLEAEIAVAGTDNIKDFGFIISEGTNTNKISAFNSNKFKIRLLTDLKPNIEYACRAYITTNDHLVYGNVVNFVSLGSTLPQIYDMNPQSGFDGDTVKINGKYFSSFPENNKVYVNDKVAKIVLSTDSTITFITPSQSFSGSADITIEVNSLKVKSTQKFTIIGPQISSISSLIETPGKVISINGTNLIRNGSNIAISFGQYNAEILNSTNTRIDVLVPIPTFNLLADNYAMIKLTNGLKTITYPAAFTIKKSWVRKSPPLKFDWPTRYQEAFSYNGKGYMHDVNYGNMYEYDPQTNSWGQFGTSAFPSVIYDKSLYIPYNDMVFRVGGIDYLYAPLKKLWSYNMVSNQWTMKSNLPFSFSNAGYFILENQIYILTYEGQLWQCDFEMEQYIRLNDFPVKIENFFVSAFIANGNAYAVQYGKTWLYDKQNDKWIPKTANPFSRGYYSTYAKCISFNNTGYVLNNGTDLYKYDYVNDKWILRSMYPGEWASNSEKSIFILGNEAYFAAISSNYVGGAPLMFLYQE